MSFTGLSHLSWEEGPGYAVVHLVNYCLASQYTSGCDEVSLGGKYSAQEASSIAVVKAGFGAFFFPFSLPFWRWLCGNTIILS